jgi:phosphatidylglycerophosphate synthase
VALTLVPCGLSLIRLAAAPILWWLLLSGDFLTALVLLGLAALTDVLDGPSARRLGVASAAGAHLDVWADFAVLLAAYGALAQLGALPLWLPLVISGMFAQFILGAHRGRLVYDPIGKHYGTLLYSAALALLLLPDAAFAYALTLGILALTLLSLVSRARALVPLATRANPP